MYRRKALKTKKKGSQVKIQKIYINFLRVKWGSTTLPVLQNSLPLMVLNIHPQQPEYTGLWSVNIEFFIISIQHPFNDMLCTQLANSILVLIVRASVQAPFCITTKKIRDFLTILPVRERIIVITIHTNW